MVKEDEIRAVYNEFIMINLLEDYKFTNQELKEVLWQNPEELCFKLIYNQFKYKSKDEVIEYNVFKGYFRIAERLLQEANDDGHCLDSLIKAQLADDEQTIDPMNIWKLIQEEKTVEKQLQLYDTFLAQNRIKKTEI